LAAQEATLAAQAAEKLSQAKAEAARKLAQAEAENQHALAEAAQAESDALAAQEATLAAQAAKELGEAEKGRAQAQAKADKERARAQAKAEKEHARELAQAEKERGRELAQEKAEKQHAFAEAAQAESDALAAQEATLAARAATELEEAEKDHAQELARAAKELEQQRALRNKAEEELTPFVKAAEARQQIVDLLNENFKEYDASAVEIDEKTGKVRLNFQESYFVRGSHELSAEMKNFLRIMIPKYARSIYENENAAELIESLKISGMTSPVYMGKYIDINDTSPRSERARQYNMSLSNKRAVAMYNFIFDEGEMGNYQYRTRLKKDMGIAALGFQHARPVRADLVGKEADCLEYNCKQEQATILQFRLYTEELAGN
jgi:hypothetical protein